MQLENRNRFQTRQDQKEIRNLKQGYLILNEYQFWKIQVSRIMISIKEPNKRQIEKLENQNRFQACQDQIEIITLKQGYLILNEYQFWKI